MKQFGLFDEASVFALFLNKCTVLQFSLITWNTHKKQDFPWCQSLLAVLTHWRFFHSDWRFQVNFWLRMWSYIVRIFHAKKHLIRVALWNLQKSSSSTFQHQPAQQYIFGTRLISRWILFILQSSSCIFCVACEVYRLLFLIFLPCRHPLMFSS